MAVSTRKPVRLTDFYSSQNYHIPQKTKLYKSMSAALLAMAISSPALAQDAEDNSLLEEVIVTATKRSESIMDVPIAMTAWSGDFVRDAMIDDVKDLVNFVPGVSGNSQDSFLDNIAVRGIRTNDFGNGGDPSVAIYKNNLYEGRNGSAVSSNYDLERVEILRGPQGFLFGRNSIGGAISTHTQRPDMDGVNGYAELIVGQRGMFGFEGAGNWVVNDSFSMRLAYYHSEENGYVKNIFDDSKLLGHTKNAVRWSARYTTDKLDVNFFAEYENRKQQGTVYRARGTGGSFNDVVTFLNGGETPEVPNSLTNVNVDNSFGSIDNGKIINFGLQFDYEFDFATFTSLTGYKDHKYDYIEDFDATNLVIFNYGQDQEGTYFQQEFRLVSNNDGPFSWYAGASFYDEDIDTVFLGQQSEDVYCGAYWGFETCQEMFDFYNTYEDGYYAYYLYYYFGTYTWTPSPDNGLMNNYNRIKGKYKGWAAYVDLSYQFSEKFDISGGIRFSDDRKDFSQLVLPDTSIVLPYRVQTGYYTPEGALRDKKSWNKLTYRLVANYHLTDETLLWGSITSGFKSGGYNSFNIKDFPGDLWGRYAALPDTDEPASFDEETVVSYEVGYKGTFNDGATQFSINAFYYDYKDLQSVFAVGPIVVVGNVGQVDGYGAEATVNHAFNQNWQVGVGVSWFDSSAHGVQDLCEGEDICEGESIPWAPEWTGYFILNANYPLSNNGAIFGNFRWSMESDRQTSWQPIAIGPSIDIDGFDEAQFLIGYQSSGSWRITGFVNNLFDNQYFDGAADGGDPANPYVNYDFGPSRPRTAGVRLSWKFD